MMEKRMKIHFVTTNKNKFREAKEILAPLEDTQIKQAKVKILEIQSMDAKKIVEDKAKKAYEKLKKPVIVEDTSLHIRSWKNFPGPFIAWVVKTIGIDGVCRMVGLDKKARAEAYVAYYDGKKMRIFSGSIDGRIARKPKGKRRFDWDRIFIPAGHSKTFAEMKIEDKNRISHRMKAFVKLRNYLAAGI